MKNNEQDLTTYREAVHKIKIAIMESRYKAANFSNKELLSLYYNVGRYISANTRSGMWGTGAIDAISTQLQGEIPGLHGFSPSNMKNMRIFFEEWASQLEPNRQLPTADLIDKNDMALNRQLPTAELEELKIMAFC